MGNAAGKQVKETVLEEGSLDKHESMSTSPSVVSKAELTTATSKGKGWMDNETGKLLWEVETKGMFKSHCLVKIDGEVVATMITEKAGITTITNWICKPTPTYDSQEALTSEELKKAGIDEGTILYKFSKVDTKRGFSAAESVYSVLNTDGQEQVLYKGEKLAALGYLALFKEVFGGTEKIVAKAATHGMSMTPTLESAKNVDLFAIVCIGTTLASNDGTAGALVGAGVI